MSGIQNQNFRQYIELDIKDRKRIKRVDGLFLRDADFDFCERIKARGYKVHIDTRFVCDHRKKIGLKRINDLLMERKNA